MSNFEEFLALIEETFSAAWKKPAKEITERGGLDIPLIPKISNATGWNKRMTVFHFTDTDNIVNVIKSQRTRRRQLSSTTNFEDRFTGVLKRGHVLQLEGNAIYGNNGDIGSGPDHSGLRWIPFNGFYKSDLSMIETAEITGELKKIYNKHSKTIPELLRNIVSFVEDNREYFPTPEDIDSVKPEYGYNEIIVDKFTVKKALINLQYVRNSERRKLNQTVSSLKLNQIPYEIFEESDDFHDAVIELKKGVDK